MFRECRSPPCNEDRDRDRGRRPAPEDPALRFIRLALAPSRERWIATLEFTGLALIGVFATVTLRIPYPVLVFAGILLLTVPPAHHRSRQAVETTGAAFFGAGFASLLAVT